VNTGSPGGRQTRQASSRRSSATESATSTPSAVTTTAPQARLEYRKAGAGHGQERQRDHDQGGVPVPGQILADLVVVQPDLALGLLEGLLHPPAAARNPDQGGQWGVGRGEADVVGQLARVAAAAAGQQPEAHIAGQPQRHSGTLVQS
jgi:hypothetical protein